MKGVRKKEEERKKKLRESYVTTRPDRLEVCGEGERGRIRGRAEKGRDEGRKEGRGG